MNDPAFLWLMSMCLIGTIVFWLGSGLAFNPANRHWSRMRKVGLGLMTGAVVAFILIFVLVVR